jgi:hypothetical protein
MKEFRVFSGDIQIDGLASLIAAAVFSFIDRLGFWIPALILGALSLLGVVGILLDVKLSLGEERFDRVMRTIVLIIGIVSIWPLWVLVKDLVLNNFNGELPRITAASQFGVILGALIGLFVGYVLFRRLPTNARKKAKTKSK